MFIFGHAPMRQIEQITTYLINNEYKNYVILLPTGRHTQIVSKIIQNIIANKEATLSRMEFYNNTDEDIEKAVNIVSDTVSNLNDGKSSTNNDNFLIFRSLFFFVYYMC